LDGEEASVNWIGGSLVLPQKLPTPFAFWILNHS
jgi:hypothetical protein